MKKSWILSVLVLSLLLCGCGKFGVPAGQTEPVTEVTTEPTIPATIPADGNPDDVTCKGSYTGAASDALVAVSGSAELTDEQLQVWFWAEVARFRQENQEISPDFSRPLEEQCCEIDDSVNSWQQYFLKKALSSWHSAQALIQHSREVPLSFEEAYQPNRANTERYMTGMPASEVLYGYYSHYRPNSMHQAYLDHIPQMLDDLAGEKGYANAEEMAKAAFGASEKALETFAETYNRGYMYFTHLSHYIEPVAVSEEQDAGEGVSVNFRQLLLVPNSETVAPDGTVTCGEEAWAACEEDARTLLKQWQKNSGGTEATFGELARKHSQDPGTMVDGGYYHGIRKGQMTKIIDDWCFAPERQAGDTAIVRSDYGVHILYFSGCQSLKQEEAEQDYYRLQQNDLIVKAREAYPIQITYGAISLEEAQGTVSMGDILYPDIAHERFPEIPLYLQQDYPKTMYGGFEIRTNGCGITSFAMVASYLLDDEVTPPEMCARYGKYSHRNGTDGMIFNKESAVMGFYLREKTYEPRIAKQALEDGHIVISIQHAGYWTRGGHYIVCESINDEGLIQVRDSNIFNYFNVRTHKEDTHTWQSITSAGSGYWIFEHKVTRIPACSRCGSPEGVTDSLLNQDYICEKCATAILRRNTYLDA